MENQLTLPNFVIHTCCCGISLHYINHLCLLWQPFIIITEQFSCYVKGILSFLVGMYSTIDDRQLDQLVTEATAQHPAIGIRMVKGYLKGKGYRIQWKRVRESLLRTDPVGLAERCRITVNRRKYNVRFPLSLWHIDGNHKLIRYLLQVLFRN